MIRIISFILSFVGVFLLILKFFGFASGLQADKLYLPVGLSCFFLGISLQFVQKRIDDKKVQKIIESYKGEKVHDPKKMSKSPKDVPQGWSMNNSPYRERKSGVTWGGGNIKGANATRGKRKGFLR